MPHHEIHERKKTKNYALLLVLCLMIGMFFTVTIVKLHLSNKNAAITTTK
jgi:hypothetical protein